SIKITVSERRWGSCSGNNRLCFSYRLREYMENHPEFIDAVIIHELAHLEEKNHGASFWSLVYSWMPEYEMIMKNRGGNIE
ncbi:M48 family metallopeptidase, partial [Candidatus Gracilibacteria bacterium]|nr:M48 family metallopeptidase [Candidatus Gracilibacteria bacterium]